LLYELSDYNATGLTADDLTDDLSADEIVEMILRRESAPPWAMDMWPIPCEFVFGTDRDISVSMKGRR
jgi:hypothetical protein